MLELPVKPNRNADLFIELSTRLMDSSRITSQSQQLDDFDQEISQGPPATPWVPTLICPYIPHVSEWLRSLAVRFGVRSWMSYGGNMAQSFSNFKDKYHNSKSQFSIYAIDCSCGTKYVGESGRNLKVRIGEHKLQSSNSAISLHTRTAGDNHVITENMTTVIAQERNPRKRKFMESAVIKSKAARLCNTGPSVYVSDIWSPSLASLARSLAMLD